VNSRENFVQAGDHLAVNAGFHIAQPGNDLAGDTGEDISKSREHLLVDAGFHDLQVSGDILVQGGAQGLEPIDELLVAVQKFADPASNLLSAIIELA